MRRWIKHSGGNQGVCHIVQDHSENCTQGILLSYWVVPGFGHPSSKKPELQEANSTSVISCCSWREAVTVAQFGVNIGCNSLNSSADRWEPALLSMGTVPSPALPGAVLPCKTHPLLCTYFTWAFRWAVCSHSGLHQQKRQKSLSPPHPSLEISAGCSELH